MLIHDFAAIGNRLFTLRKRAGMTQMEVAEAAGLAHRTYADIERGTANMRIESFLRICDALHVTPDELLTCKDDTPPLQQEEILHRLNTCSDKDRDTALRLLDVYLRSLE